MATLPTSALMIYFRDYESYHTHQSNKACHFIGVPLVMFSALGLLSNVVLYGSDLIRLDLGIILWFISSVFSIRVDAKLAVPFILFSFLNYLIARHLPMNTLIAIQIAGWVFQLAGHFVYEKRSPAFFMNLSHLFIGPMWILAKMIGYYKP